jgi:carbonic anhydrase
MTIGDNVNVAPNASIRADELGSRIIIGAHSNIQDSVILYAAIGSELNIGQGSTLAHSFIVTCPATIGEGCFVGFGSMVFQSTLMDGCVVKHRALVDRTMVPSARLITSGTIIDGELRGSDHSEVPEDIIRFVATDWDINMKLSMMYNRADPNWSLNEMG